MNIGLWIAIGLVAVTFLSAVVGFRRWKRNLLADLRSRSQIAQTSRGPVEYALDGAGSVVLYFHGTVGGYDQGLMCGRFLAVGEGEPEFTMLAPSRPGYLGTPLATGRTPEEQADALAALLDQLGIDQAAVIGASGGAAFALQFVLRHPHRASALVLFSAITQRMPPRRRGPLGKAFLSARLGPPLQDLLAAVMHFLARFRTSRLMRRVFRGMTARSISNAEIRKRVAAIAAHPEQVRFFQGMIHCMIPLSARMAGILNDEEQLARLSDFPFEQIAAPTLALHGRDDSLGGSNQAEAVADRIPGAELHLVEGGHFIWIGDHAERMRSVLRGFLRKHVPRRGVAGVTLSQRVSP
jgi:pimeloyl-ACP methyl ester carboxylesterase